MMQDVMYVEKNEQGVDEVRINNVKSVEAPFFTPEIGGPEGLQGLLYAKDALESENPFMVPGHRWQDIRSKPRFKEVEEEIRDLVSTHPIYYYEPVEIYRYTRPQNLVTYAFQGDQGSSRDFYSKLRDEDYRGAVKMLPTFFQPFVEKQMGSLLKSKDINIPTEYKSKSSGKVYEAWRDKRADSGFTQYFERIANDAGKSPNAAVIPPVPPVMKSTGPDAVSRTIGFNSYMRTLCESKWKEASTGSVTPYLHFYIDQGVFEPSNNNNDHRVKQAIRSEISDASYAGVALTLSNLRKVWRKGIEKNLERFISDVTSIAREEHLPVILPRSGYFGMYLSDHGVQSFSTLMNGNQVYSRRGGGITERARYGTLPIYGSARDVNAEELNHVLGRSGGSVHDIDGLPNSPPCYNPSADSYEGKFGNASQFRIQFGKPRRLVHVKEAEELREGLRRGTAEPANRYLERSDHAELA